jgi:hypothetical protein
MLIDLLQLPGKTPPSLGATSLSLYPDSIMMKKLSLRRVINVFVKSVGLEIFCRKSGKPNFNVNPEKKFCQNFQDFPDSFASKYFLDLINFIFLAVSPVRPINSDSLKEVVSG